MRTQFQFLGRGISLALMLACVVDDGLAVGQVAPRTVSPLVVVNPVPLGVFRIVSASTGIAFVVHSQGRILFLVTSLAVLGEDVRQPGGPECALDHNEGGDSLPCEVAYLYPEINLAVLRADASDYLGAFAPLALADSVQLATDSQLNSAIFAEKEKSATMIPVKSDRTTPFSLRLVGDRFQLGSPVVAAGKVVAIVTDIKAGEVISLSVEAMRLALSSEQVFRSLQPLN